MLTGQEWYTQIRLKNTEPEFFTLLFQGKLTKHILRRFSFDQNEKKELVGQEFCLATQECAWQA